MTLYSVALFLHVVGAVLLFTALTVEGVGLRQLRGAPGDLRLASSVLGLNRFVGPVAGLAVLVPGLYMTAASWGWTAWILVGLVSWALIAGFGAATGIRIMRLGRRAAAAPEPEASRRLQDPVFPASWLVRAGLAMGVLFLMTVKPGLAGSLAAVLVGAAAGLALSVPGFRRTGPPVRA
jgi:hypothetical protein